MRSSWIVARGWRPSSSFAHVRVSRHPCPEYRPMHDLTQTRSELHAFCTFRADQRLFGIDVACLREINTNTVITPVPPAPPVVRGLANLRSRVHLILDLRPLLGLPPADCTPDSRLIMLKPAVTEDVGLLVDRGGDILRV